MIALALLPLTILTLIVVLSFLDHEYGFPAVVGSAIGMAAGVVAYSVAAKRRAASRATERVSAT